MTRMNWKKKLPCLMVNIVAIKELALKHMRKVSRMLLDSLNVPSALRNWNHKVYMDAHTKTHEQTEPFKCDICPFSSQTNIWLKMHLNIEHAGKTLENWNCNDCSFQANNPSELMNHLKLTTHQPSPNVSDKKKLFSDYKRCYTCNLEVDGYWNLMNHRKEAHPSNKKCRDFPDGKCNFGLKCWYVHEEELMDLDESFKNEEPRHKYYICSEEFATKDQLKRHRKSKHIMNVQTCEKFLLDKCDRKEEQCWYKHVSDESNPKSKSNPVIARLLRIIFRR